MKSILTADIGGTNSRFGFFRMGPEGSLSLVETKWLRTREAKSFEDLLRKLSSSGFSLGQENADTVVIAVAGPVRNGTKSQPPFISWDIDIADGSRYGFRQSHLINDFVAQAFACRSPIAESARMILPGTVVRDAALAVIGAGTALGQAALVPDGHGGFVAVPSEGGHGDFPFVTPEEWKFHDFLVRELGGQAATGVSVVSGKGLSLVHKFLTGEELEPRDAAKRLSSSQKTLAWAARFYGRACRNYALQTVALGGVYVAGGVAAKSPELLTHDAFREEFRSAPAMAELLAHIPVFLITDEESGLWGSAWYGRQRLLAVKRNPV